MRISFIIFSLFFSLAHAAENWQSLATHLMNKDEQEEGARKKLSETQQLDESLKKALESSGEDERLALETIRRLPRPSMINELMHQMAKMKPEDDKTAYYAITLMSLIPVGDADKILTFLQTKFDLTSLKISSALRIAILTSMAEKEKVPDVKVLEKLLEDTSYEMRLKTFEVAWPYLLKDPAKYKSFLKKSLTSSPYPLRLKAVDAVASLPENIRKEYQRDIEKCSSSDENNLVKEKCSDLIKK